METKEDPQEAGEGPEPVQTTHDFGIEWVGSPIRVDADNKEYYTAAIRDGVRFSLGDTVFLTPLEPGVDPYIGKITELIRIPIQPEGKDSGTEGAVEPGVIPEEPEGVERVTMPAQHLVTVKWYYRLQELELDGPLPVYENEIFASEDVATHPIAAVSGHCIVESPTSTIAFRPGVFVCSRKYIPQEGRIVPMEGELEYDHPRPLLLLPDTHQLVPMTKAAISGTSPPLITPTITLPPLKAPETKSPLRLLKEPSKRKRRHVEQAAESGGVIPSISTSDEAFAAVSEGGGPGRSSGETAAATTPKRSGGSAGTPRSRGVQHGRWASDRYEGAKRHLVHVLHVMDATSPDKAILRPLLREEARKVIGDTGLLDHLLKHLVDQTVSEQGERLRRRHNAEGQMIYWLQSPAAAKQEEAQLREEMEALTSELREVREARHMLRAVRQEAAEAVQAVSGVRNHPEYVAKALATGPGTPSEQAMASDAALASRVENLEKDYVNISRRMYDAESMAASSIEAVRQDTASAGSILSAQIAACNASIAALDRKVSEMENKYIYLSEDIISKFEAMASALQQSGYLQQWQQELARRDASLAALHQEVSVLKALIAGLGAALPSETLARWSHLQQQYLHQIGGTTMGNIPVGSSPLEQVHPSGAGPVETAPHHTTGAGTGQNRETGGPSFEPESPMSIPGDSKSPPGDD